MLTPSRTCSTSTPTAATTSPATTSTEGVGGGGGGGQIPVLAALGGARGSSDSASPQTARRDLCGGAGERYSYRTVTGAPRAST